MTVGLSIQALWEGQFSPCVRETFELAEQRLWAQRDEELLEGVNTDE